MSEHSTTEDSQTEALLIFKFLCPGKRFYSVYHNTDLSPDKRYCCSYQENGLINNRKSYYSSVSFLDILTRIQEEQFEAKYKIKIADAAKVCKL